MRPYGCAPAQKATWFVPTTRRQELLILSHPRTIDTHFDLEFRRTRRCGGPRCMGCHLHVPMVPRHIVMCHDTNNREKLLELRERHLQALDSYSALVGVRVAVKKSGEGRNCRVQIEAIGVEEGIPAREIDALCKTFYLPAAFVPGVQSIGDGDEWDPWEEQEKTPQVVVVESQLVAASAVVPTLPSVAAMAVVEATPAEERPRRRVGRFVNGEGKVSFPRPQLQPIGGS